MSSSNGSPTGTTRETTMNDPTTEVTDIDTEAETETTLPPVPWNSGKVAWRVKEWAESVGLGLTTVNKLIKARRISSVLIGDRRLITTSPAKFIEEASENSSEGQT